MRRLPTVAAVALTAQLALASQATGHSFYVDAGAGPGGNCLAPESACATIGQALAAGDPDPGSPDVVVVSPGTYTENVVLDSDRSLITTGIGAKGSHLIQPAGPGPTVRITGPANVVGFTIDGAEPVLVDGPGRLLRNFFGGGVPDGGEHVLLADGAGSAIVERNSFEDDGAGTETAVRSSAAGSPQIIQNGFWNFWRGIEVTAGTPALDRNAIVHGTTGIQIGAGAGVVTVTSNRVTGAQSGIVVDGAVLLATNLTAVDNAVDISLLNGADLALNSSVVKAPIAATATSDCAISFSAGPQPPQSPADCSSFQTTSAVPGFVAPASGNYRLRPSSSLVDAGDPSRPSSGSFDLDGEPRAAAGTCGAPKRRDIGADELVPDCPAGDTDAPHTRIRRKKVNRRAVTFRFRSDERGSEFRCKLDGRPWRPCESPTRYGRLEAGRHIFRVKAIDGAGNEDSRPARRRFRIR